MDNFRKPKHRKKGVAIDGIIQSNPDSNSSFRRPQSSYRPATRPNIGNFQQKDGFHPARRPAMAAATSAVAAEQARPSVLLSSTPADTTTKRKKTKVKKSRNWRKIIKRSALALTVLVILCAGYVFGKGWWNARKVLQGGGGASALHENVDPSKLKGEGDGRVNILILGKGGAGHEAPDLTDTILVASIDPIHKEAALVSIPRDFYVKPSGEYSYSKINAIYANAKSSVLAGKKTADQKEKAEQAGLDALQKTVQDVLGIPIHYRGIIDFEGFRKAIDTVGGIDINVKTPVFENMGYNGRGYRLDVKAGWQHFDGVRALMYSRSRYTSSRGDFDRAERQREVIIALKDKVFSAGTFGNPVKITQLMDAFGGHVQTNFTIDELARLYTVTKEISSNKVQSIGLADPPNNYLTTGNYNGQSVVVPRAGLGNYKELQTYIRTTLKDSYIRNENASILVLNGTTRAGLASTRAEDLKSYGYNITQVADAPTKNYSKTVLVDLRDGAKKYTKHYLEKRLGVTATTKLPDATINPGTADFVIILGPDS